MFKESLKSFIELFISPITYILIVISAIIVLQGSVSSLSVFVPNIPIFVATLFCGILTTIAIIFSVIDTETMNLISDKYGSRFLDSITNLKKHVMVIIELLVLSSLGFVIEISSFGLFDRNYEFKVFCGFQIFYFFMTIFITLEIVNILFMIFEIKFRTSRE